MMETLVAVAQHRNQYYLRDVNQRGQPKFEIGSPLPSQSFRELSCRTFQSGVGLLPTPFNDLPTPAAVSNQTPGSGLKAILQGTPIAIPAKVRSVEKDEGIIRDELLNRRVCYSELWAGPAYSNSPPPSSLPIPKFSLRSKRTTSLDLPDSAMAVDGFSVHYAAKSAPSSPTRTESRQSKKVFFHSADSATQTLRPVEVVPVSCSFLEDIDPVVLIVVRSSIKVREEAYFCHSDCLPMLARRLCGIPTPYCLLLLLVRPVSCQCVVWGIKVVQCMSCVYVVSSLTMWDWLSCSAMSVSCQL
ncbi:hypothetical protein MLD38_025072 [Melastoma candidum]|uniref:Uncharacterized protein n=1 Tax=Melastoma candidum TaxID=119954 RepID=A0ACB9NVY8_9MYRT|nr:hypothetical protein MLD38_025072 [Melastoma candidum]